MQNQQRIIDNQKTMDRFYHFDFMIENIRSTERFDIVELYCRDKKAAIYISSFVVEKEKKTWQQ